jgi:tRNA-dihydrouridine synthase B
MAGITDTPFRDLVSRFGVTAVVSEMVSSEAMVRSRHRVYKRSTYGSSIQIIQLVGISPQRMAESAIISEDLGVDAIDINMGCPARKVVSGNSGAALMRDEDLAVKIAESVVKAVKIPVTLKMRLGWDDEHRNHLSLAKKFEEVGIKMLAIHCRTRSQMYGGKANWLAIAELRNAVKIPYLCNGDIKSPEDAVCALEKSLAHGVMVGRAVLGKPWLPNQIIQLLDGQKIIQTPSIVQQFHIIMEHFQSVLDFYGIPQGIKIFRKHFCWYSGGLSGSACFRENINHVEDLNSIKNYVEDFYERHFQDILYSEKEVLCLSKQEI